MKLSIWQQFSSNHSASFRVVGVFESAEKAEVAFHELLVILKQIREGTLPPPYSDEGELLTPSEIALRDKYKVDWPASINWYRWESAWDYDESPARKHDSLVFIRSPHLYIYTGPQPFNEILQRLGAKVFVDADVSTTYPQTALLVDFRFKIPSDEDQAKILIGIIKSDFDNAHRPYYDATYRNKIDVGLASSQMEWDFVGNPRLLEMDVEKDAVKLYGLIFGDGRGWFEHFVAFEAYLKNFGCTEIEYTFHSERHNLPTHG